MAEDSDLERTEPATGRRISQAREKGQVVQSRELNTFVMLIAALGTLMVFGDYFMSHLTLVVKEGLTIERAVATNPKLITSLLYRESLDTLITFLPFMVVMIIAAIAAPVSLGGLLFTFEPLQPNFSKLNPLTGMKRFVSWTALVELGKAVAKTLLIGGIASAVIWNYKNELFALVSESMDQSAAHMGHLIMMTALMIVSSIAIIVLVDVPFQLWDYAKKLRMTKEEVKQEAKEMEGDPQIKARIRRAQREAARRRMMGAVPKADVIVTNPTHFAVALQYQEGMMRAPHVVAKGASLLAERIIEIGKENHVPVMEAPPLARALYKYAEIGDEIPAALYTAVAEVLAYVYQLKQYETGSGGAIPVMPRDLPVPVNMDPEQARQ